MSGSIWLAGIDRLSSDVGRLSAVLLLRRDLHALFDRGDLLIDPEAGWRVYVRPNLAEYPEVWQFNGKELLAKPASRPKAMFLQNHANAARERWASTSE
jgi:hypothetical protein